MSWTELIGMLIASIIVGLGLRKDWKQFKKEENESFEKTFCPSSNHLFPNPFRGDTIYRTERGVRVEVLRPTDRTWGRGKKFSD